MMSLHFKVFTLFPGLFPGPLDASLVGKARNTGLWSVEAVNLRDYAFDKHQSVDDTTYGGGPGMVFRPDVVDQALRAHYTQRPQALIYLSPRGKPLQQTRVKQLAKVSEIGLLCGRFEGIDQRVLDAWNFEEVSIGDYVLSGGEIPAMILIDACVRLLPNVMGCSDTLLEESFDDGLLEYPHYTRPQIWADQGVPEVLSSGHHEKIKAWRHAAAEQITQERRPDLWQTYLEKKQRKDQQK